MPLSDLAVLISLGAATSAVGVLLWRRGMRGRRLVTPVWIAFFGLALVTSMTAHCLDILSRLYVGQGYDGAALAYNFRLYSLMLLGAVLIGAGVRLVRAALEMSRESDAARPGAIRATLFTLAVVAPLIPIQAVFAVPLTALAALSLLLLGLPPAAPARRPAGMADAQRTPERVPAGR